MGHSPKRVLVWGPRRDARPAGERRSGGALEGCLSHRDSDPTWSKARDDAHELKERHGGELYRLSPSGDSATPKALTNYPQNKLIFPVIIVLINPYFMRTKPNISP